MKKTFFKISFLFLLAFLPSCAGNNNYSSQTSLNSIVNSESNTLSSDENSKTNSEFDNSDDTSMYSLDTSTSSNSDTSGYIEFPFV